MSALFDVPPPPRKPQFSEKFLAYLAGRASAAEHKLREAAT